MVLVATGVLIAGPPGPALAADGCPCLAIHHPDGSVDVLTAADIGAQADVENTQYQTRAVAHGPTQDEPYIDHGLSIRGALQSLTPPIDPADVGFTETPRANGSWSTLTTPDLADPADFADGLRPAVRVDGSVLEYVRPLHADDGDVNADDLLRTASSGTLDLFVHTGPLVTVTVTASSTHVTPGEAVTLTASATDPQTPSQPLAVSWQLGDGTGASGASTAHGYPTAGTYTVIATVSGSDGAGGASDPLVITVGSGATASASPAPGGSTTRTPPAHPGSAARTAARHPSTETPATERTSAPSRAPASTAAELPDAPGGEPAASTAPPTRGPTPVGAPEDTIAGRLVGAGVPVDPAVLRPAASFSATPVPPSSGFRPGRAAGLAAAVLLVLLGAGSEMRSQRRSGGPR